MIVNVSLSERALTELSKWTLTEFLPGVSSIMLKQITKKISLFTAQNLIKISELEY